MPYFKRILLYENYSDKIITIRCNHGNRNALLNSMLGYRYLLVKLVRVGQVWEEAYLFAVIVHKEIIWHSLQTKLWRMD